jgi:hypothetical protein
MTCTLQSFFTLNNVLIFKRLNSDRKSTPDLGEGNASHYSVLQTTLVQRLVSHFPTGQIMFDAYNSLGLRAAKNHKSIKATGAVIGWGTDTPRELETWSPRLKFMEE